MAVRKKWATRLHPAEKWKQHPSQAAAYLYVRQLADEYRVGMLRRDLNRVTVRVDEGLGRGWQLYETVDLADVAGMTEEN